MRTHMKAEMVTAFIPCQLRVVLETSTHLLRRLARNVRGSTPKIKIWTSLTNFDELIVRIAPEEPVREE